MKIDRKKLIFYLALPALSGFLSRKGISSFASLQKPPLSPPAWLFGVVWPILYGLMGLASYLVAMSESKSSLLVYYLTLFFNFFWSLIFFNLQMYLFAFIWLVILWALILLTIILFYQSSKIASYLMIPYLLWVTFAGYLNYAIYLLN